MLIGGAGTCYYGYTRGYGDGYVEASVALTLWAMWWVLAASTRDQTFVRRSLKLALLPVLPAPFDGMYGSTSATEFLFNFLVALVALLSAGGYGLAYPKERSR